MTLFLNVIFFPCVKLSDLPRPNGFLKLKPPLFSRINVRSGANVHRRPDQCEARLEEDVWDYSLA